MKQYARNYQRQLTVEMKFMSLLGEPHTPDLDVDIVLKSLVIV